ncbi:MAG: PAS domain S-box protein [Bacteroidia bacterium]|nr:PAS domain S-box protein [Bacteroidia bacterium]
MDSILKQNIKETQLDLQAYLAAIVKYTDDAVITKSMDGIITYWNAGAERMFGYKADEVIGKSINTLAPTKIDEHKLILEKYNKGEKIEHYETQRIKKDGSKIDVSLTVSPIIDDKNVVIGFSNIARDITKRSLYSRYVRSLIEASLDPLVIISTDGKITDVNEASVKVTGVPREKLIGTGFSTYFTESEKAQEGYKQVFEKGFATDYPLTIKHTNGKLTDVLFNLSVYKDNEGSVIGVVAAARDITERKKAEGKFHGLLESAPDAIVIINNKGEIQLVNSQTEKLFGYKREEIIGKGIEILIPSSYKDVDPAHRKTFFDNPKARKMGHGIDLFGQHNDGKEFPVEISLNPFETPDGLLVSVAIRDVTEQKQAIQYTRSLIEASLDPLVTISADGKITDLNEASVKVTGIPREDMIGTDFLNYFTEPKKAREVYQQVFEKNFVADYPLTIRNISGKLTDVLYNASLFKDNNGKVLGVFATARDVTQQKLLEKKLIEYKHFFNHTSDFACIANMQGYFEIINPNFEKVLGYSEKELLENKFVDFVHPDDIESTQKEIDKLKTGAVTINFVNRYRKKDGNYLWFDWNTTPDTVTGRLYAMARDITDRKNAETHLKQISQELTRSNQELEQFAYIASHDLQEPLRTISSFMQLLDKKQGNKKDEETKEYFQFIMSATEKMKNLIRDLLDYSRVGKSIVFSTVDCNLILKEVIAEMDASITESKAKITSAVLPKVNGNEIQLKQLFQNLISNGIKFKKKNSIPEIDITVEEKPTEYLFALKDKGIGIDEKYINKLFVLFQRLHSETEYSGTGIGLAICKKIVTMHGGKIWVESKLGEGSTFYFTIAK